MTAFVLVTGLLNLALGFVLAVYLGAAPRFADPRFPLLRDGHREPTGFIKRLVSLLPKRAAKS